ncbi:hypothetical protein [Ancylobacter sp. SL191]|uniref:hypothetical protein n=1 Tax=Ancylobacter sp. SL191 TaxID=2995166 RepID=UPI0022715742|nr:hypothetical protein [Ancylobacter sp. SL191]WAC27341.1 hypothetical protein OU996_20480 [Ancylobacter sp. SL191]
MIRIATAATLIAALALPVLGVSAASAGGRSKDDRAAFWQTLHQEVEPWSGQMVAANPAPGTATAPAMAAAPVKSPATTHALAPSPMAAKPAG